MQTLQGGNITVDLSRASKREHSLATAQVTIQENNISEKLK